MNPGLNLKADAALAVQLIVRHRAPQLAAVVLTCAVIVIAKWGVPASSGGVSPFDTLLAAAAVQGGIIGSRLSTPAALAAARAAGADTSLMVIGRLAGAAAVLLPVLFVQVAAVAPIARAGIVLTIAMSLALWVAAGAMGLARWTGSTSASFLVSAAALLAVPMLAQTMNNRADSGSVALVVTGVGFIAVTAGAASSLRERPLLLRKPTPLTRTRGWGRHAGS